MFHLFKRSAAPTTQVKASPSAALPSADPPTAVRPSLLDAGLRYPPADPGLPAVPVADIVGSQSLLIDRLRVMVGADHATFASRYLAPITAVAEHVHLLPASACAHFSGPGGLFRLCLEMAVFSRQAADARLFTPDASAEDRHAMEPRWRYAAFLAGLLAELRGTLAQVVITLPAGQAWPAHLGSLSSWLVDQSCERYHVCWRRAIAEPSGLPAVASLVHQVARQAFAWLDGGPAGVSEPLLAAILGDGASRGHANPLVPLVGATRSRVLEADAATRAGRYGTVQCGHHLELHLLDAMRHAVGTGLWSVADPNGLLWLHEGGLYLEWPRGASAMRDLAQANGIRGIPLSAITLADVLGDAGVLMPAPGTQGGWLWQVDTHAVPAENSEPAGEGAARAALPARAALRLTDPRAVLGHTRDPSGSPVTAAPAHIAAGPRIVERSVVLGDEEQRLGAAWRQRLQEGRSDLLVLLPGPCLAVSQDLLAADGAELARVAAALDRRGWLGRGDWPAPHAKAGLLTFAGRRKPGLVVNATGVHALGLLAS